MPPLCGDEGSALDSMLLKKQLARHSTSLYLKLSRRLKRELSLNQINYRRCISCRRVAPKKTFWRIVRLASSRKIQLDQGMGRSAYLCPNIKCLSQAKTKNRLQGALRTKISDDIYQNLQERLS